MSENNRNPIEKCRKKLSQFTTMNVIDGQAGLVRYYSLIFYSLTINNILNIIILLIISLVNWIAFMVLPVVTTVEENAKKLLNSKG